MTKRMVPTQKSPEDMGSPETGEPVFLVIGKIRRPHGVAGEMVMDLMTDFPERLKKGKELYVGATHEIYKIRSIRQHNPGVLIAFEGFVDCDSAGRFRNQLVYTLEKEVPRLPEGEYYFHDLLGLTVENEINDPIGILTEILETGANDVYVVRDPSGKDILIPAIDGVILDVNMERKTLRVKLQEWS